MPEETYCFSSYYGAGARHYKCWDCSFYVANNEPQMKQHCRDTGHGSVPRQIDKYIAQQLGSRGLTDVMITLGYLCWNTKTASTEGLLALIEEAKRLRRLGCVAKILVVDNGSVDGSLDSMLQASRHIQDSVPIDFRRFPENRGISVARNLIIQMAVDSLSDFHLFMDGDIEIVPLSSYLMARYLMCHGHVGCIGACSSMHVKSREAASKLLLEIPESAIHSDIDCAWTQYGMFRSSMFRQGLRFETGGPLGEPGWGFEDDDFCFQMLDAGWDNRYFGGMHYLHRNIRSSWPNLEAMQVDPEAMFHKRKDFILNKWGQKCFNPDILSRVASQKPPITEISLTFS